MDASEHSMHLLIKNRVEKVSIRNIKAFIPRENRDLGDDETTREIPYNLRRREMINYAVLIAMNATSFFHKRKDSSHYLYCPQD